MKNNYHSPWPLNKVASTHDGGHVPNVTLKTRNNEAKVMVMSDIHFGSIANNIPLFEKHLELAEQEHAYIILLGDIFETALPSRIEESVWEQYLTTGQQYRMARSYFDQYRDKVLFSVSGNHDARVWKKTGFDLAERFAEDMGCFYNNHGGYLVINVGSQQYVFSGFHGASAGANPWLELEKRLVTYDKTDIMCMGNNHQLDAKRVIKKTIDLNGDEQRKAVWLVRTGSYMTEPDYGRVSLYPPTLDGSPLITFSSKRRYIHVDVEGELRWDSQ